VPLERPTALPRPALDPAQRRVGFVRRTLAARGLVEAVTFSFMASGDAALFGGVKPELRLINPISADLEIMRPSVLPNLAAASRRNADRGLADSALFEIGAQYHDDTPEGQATVAAGLRHGQSGPRHWRDPGRPVDAFTAKADALAALAAAGVPTDNLQVSAEPPDWYHPGRAGSFRLGAKALAHFGELHPAAAQVVALSAGRARFRLSGARRSAGGEPVARGARRRQEADRRDPPVRRL
jgi:phenylalanyl-tRNA synthetase beta chain